MKKTVLILALMLLAPAAVLMGGGDVEAGDGGGDEGWNSYKWEDTDTDTEWEGGDYVWEDGEYYNTTTNQSGNAELELLTIRWAPDLVEYNPFNFTATKEHYRDAEEEVIVDNITHLSFTLAAISIDLEIVDTTLLISDKSFAVHLFGEEASIIVNITNNGSDDAAGEYAVPVFFYDADDNTLATALVEVPAGETREAVGLFPNLEPGWSNVTVAVDPYRSVVPDEKDRNYLQRNVSAFRVNVPPGLNITSDISHPLNGTVDINGTAWDNASDEGNIGNVSVQYRIGGGEWADANMDLENATDGVVNHTVPWFFSLNTTLIDNGNYTLVIRADDGNHSTTISRDITIYNPLPFVLNNVIITPETGNISVGFNITVEYSGHQDRQPVVFINFTDVPYDAEAYNLSMNSSNLEAGVGTFYHIFRPSAKGNHTFHIAASDGTRWNSTGNNTIIVENTPPRILDYGANRSHVAWGWNVTFYAVYQDDDGDPPEIHILTFNGTEHVMEQGEENFTHGTTNYTISLPMNARGIHGYNFTFSDGDNTTTTGTRHIHVNSPPILEDPTMEHKGDGIWPRSSESIFFDITYMDEDNDRPSVFQIHIQGAGYFEIFDMTATGNNFAAGVLYTKEVTLPRGEYNYTFVFADDFNETQSEIFPLFVNNTPPFFHFESITPLGDARYNVSWDVYDVDGDPVDISLYFQRGEEIEELGLEEHGDGWGIIDLSGRDSGLFNLHAVACDGTENVTASYEDIYLNHNPVVEYVTPKETVQVNKEYAITWSAYDPDGDDIVVDLHYSIDESEWNIVASSLSNTGEYTWNTSETAEGKYVLGEGNYTIRLTASDSFGSVYNTTSYSTGTVYILRPKDTATLDLNPSTVFQGRTFTASGYIEFHPSPDSYPEGHAREVFMNDAQGETFKLEIDEDGAYSVTLFAPPEAGRYSISVWVAADEMQSSQVVTRDIIVEALLPDFSVSSDDIIPSNRTLVEGRSVAYTIRIRNLGSLGGDCQVKVYIPTLQNEVLLEDTIWIPAGGDVRVVAYWESPVPGRHTINVELVSQSPVEEIRLDNNDARLEFRVIHSDEYIETEEGRNPGPYIAFAIFAGGLAAVLAIKWQRKK